MGRNVLGYPNELPVTMEEMLHHVKAVARGAEHAMVVGDMPFMSFQASVEDGVRNAGRLIKEGGAHAVKIEGVQLDLVQRLVDIGIPVMAHIGLTPQSVYGLGGLKVQGRGEAADEGHGAGDAAREGRRVRGRAGGDARRTRRGDLAIPADPDDRHRRRARVAMRRCLVIHDLLGLTEKPPKLAKAYADLRGTITEAVEAFVADVERGEFPDSDHSYS